jgi:hypothetical protein
MSSIDSRVASRFSHIRKRESVTLLRIGSGAYRHNDSNQPNKPLLWKNEDKILPDEGKLRLYRNPLRAVVHEPLSTIGLTQADTVALKERCFQIIDETLREYHKS